MSQDDKNDGHIPGKTDLAGIADRIKQVRGTQDAAAFGFHVFLYRHESIDVEAALRAEPSASRPIKEAKQLAEKVRDTAEKLADKIQDCADIPDGVPWSQDELDLIETALRAYSPTPSSDRATNAALQEVEDALWTLHSYESNRDDAGRSYSEAEITKMVSAIRALAPASATSPIKDAARKALRRYIWNVRHPGAPIAGAASLDAAMVELRDAFIGAGEPDYNEASSEGAAKSG